MFDQDFPVNFSSESSRGGEETPTVNQSRYVADSLLIGNATVVGAGVTAVTAAELPPANRPRTLKEIILERYTGRRAGVPQPDRQQQPAK